MLFFHHPIPPPSSVFRLRSLYLPCPIALQFHAGRKTMKLQALTTVVVLAFCSLQALAHPTLSAETRDISNGTSTATDTYTVAAGDSLDAIAAAEGITTQQLEEVNRGVSPTDLQVGEVLNVPASANSTEAR